MAACIVPPAPRDAPLDRVVPPLPGDAHGAVYNGSLLSARYDFEAWLDSQRQLPKHAIFISMSGGSTRAATMAQSVLRALSQFRVPGTPDRPEQSLADDVVAISAVSGGAMTAAAFVLGRAACPDGEAPAQCDEGAIGESSSFRKNILEENLLGFFLLHGAAQPWAWPDRASPWVDFFGDAYPVNAAKESYTFGDLGSKPGAPFLILNSTDLFNDRTFSFVQGEFNDLCADLNKESVAVAVAAAGNFPFLSSDIEMRNFRVGRDSETGAAAECDRGAAAPNSDESKRLLDDMAAPYDDLQLATLARYRMGMRLAGSSVPGPGHDDDEDWKDPLRRIDWVHLYDGGIADNLGLWPLVRLLRRDTLRKMKQLGVEDITLIVVNARWDWTPQGNRRAGSPPFTDLLVDSVFDPMNRTTALTEKLAIDQLRRKYQDLCPSHEKCEDYPVGLYPVVLDFDQLTGSSYLVQLREEVKNIGDHESLGDKPDAGYPQANDGCENERCDKCPDKICVIARAGRYLLARNPCLKLLYQNSRLEYQPGDLDTLPGPKTEPDRNSQSGCRVINISQQGP